MTPPRFLADHDLNEHLIAGVLRRAPQLVFLRVREAGLAGQPDPLILAYAAGQGLLFVSHDVNTMPAAAYARMADGQRMTGLLLVPQVASVGAVIEDLLLVWSAINASEWEIRWYFHRSTCGEWAQLLSTRSITGRKRDVSQFCASS